MRSLAEARQDVFDAIGNGADAAAFVVEMSRFLYEDTIRSLPEKPGPLPPFRIGDLLERLEALGHLRAHDLARATERAISILLELGLLAEDRRRPEVFSVRSMLYRLLDGTAPFPDLRYWAGQAMRESYDCRLSHTTIDQLAGAANTITRWLERQDEERRVHDPKRSSHRYSVRKFEREVLRREGPREREMLALLLEVCRSVGYVVFDPQRQYIQFKTRSIDREYLIAQIFGMPTSIHGFDQLFSGNGLLLPEARDGAGRLDVDLLPSRLTIVKGPSGCGKSILCLQLALEIARKGGVAYVLALEQTPEEMLYALKSFDLVPPASVRVAVESKDIQDALQNPKRGEGVLVLRRSLQESMPEFLEELKGSARRLDRFALRAVIADPLNSVPLTEEGMLPWMRSELLQTMDWINNVLGVNVFVSLETNEANGASASHHYLESIVNVADTVVELSVASRAGYSQRYFEVVKSRFQREQRGRHPFSITSGEGIRTSSSPSAILARVRRRSAHDPIYQIQFGIASVDEALKGSLRAGDTIVFSGGPGLHKSDLAAHFAFGYDEGDNHSFQKSDIVDLQRLRARLLDDEAVSFQFHSHLSPEETSVLSDPDSKAPKVESTILIGLNRMLNHRNTSLRFPRFVTEAVQLALSRDVEPSSRDLLASNRLVIERLFPDELRERPPKPVATLWITPSEDIESVQSLLADVARRGRRRKPYRVLPVRSGFVDPGFVLQKIEDEFLIARREGLTIDRVIVDDIEHWETACPFVAEDEIFGSVLVEIIRRNRATGLFICPPDDSGASERRRIRNAVRSRANCVFDFRRIELRGVPRILARIRKSRTSDHEGQPFEVVKAETGIEFRNGSPLLRVDEAGASTPIPARLFLHSESEMQERYNKYIASIIRSVLTAHVQIDPLDVLDDALALGSSSALDELQIGQFDEFQLRAPLFDSRHKPPLVRLSQRFPVDQYLDSLREHAMSRGLYAIPLYNNVSFMAFRKGSEIVSMEGSAVWRHIAASGRLDAIEESLEDRHSPIDLYFDYAKVTFENYNTLFLEILYCLILESKPGILWTESDSLGAREHATIRIQDLLRPDYIVEAAELFRQVARPGYLAAMRRGAADVFTSGSNEGKVLQVDTQAQVWRHWYSTLNQMLFDMPADDRALIGIRPLPCGVSFAGEWYLGIPAHSAAIDVGTQILSQLTTRTEELDRLQFGVGLPTRKDFYEGSEDSVGFVSPYFEVSRGLLRSLVEKPYRRSNIVHYNLIRKPLAQSLHRILRVEGSRKGKPEDEIRSIISSLKETIDFVIKD